MKVTKRSILTNKINTLDIDVTDEQIAAHAAGALVQDCMPHLSNEHREFIISGITPEEWKDACSDC